VQAHHGRSHHVSSSDVRTERVMEDPKDCADDAPRPHFLTAQRIGGSNGALTGPEIEKIWACANPRTCTGTEAGTGQSLSEESGDHPGALTKTPYASSRFLDFLDSNTPSHPCCCQVAAQLQTVVRSIANYSTCALLHRRIN
jgi:hypothetical protein